MTDTGRPRFPWITTIVAAVVVVLAGFALIAYLQTVRQIDETAGKGIDVARMLVTNASSVAERFKTGSITHTFRQSIPQVSSTQGDVLELATALSEETFTRTDERRVAWDWLYLGTTVAEIRVPVTFRYHLRLSDSWRLAARDQVCIVLAPPIRPSLPPAIHTDRMEKRAESGWARFDKFDQLNDLERGMMNDLDSRATDAAHLGLVREACRQSVAAFVKHWLVREDQWRTDRFTSIVVVFPDETGAISEEELSRHSYTPAIQLEGR